jgi:hypothetical protein
VVVHERTEENEGVDLIDVELRAEGEDELLVGGLDGEDNAIREGDGAALYLLLGRVGGFSKRLGEVSQGSDAVRENVGDVVGRSAFEAAGQEAIELLVCSVQRRSA